MEATRHTGKFETVYNFRVADFHTYFVGGEDWGFSVWAHNAGSSYGGVQANKVAGDGARDSIAAREAAALTEQTFMTVGGARRIDVLKTAEELLIGIESKVGRTGLTGPVRQELARDWWLLRQNKLDDVIWEFTRSDVTGKIGPTRQLLEKLQKLGFGIRIN